MNIVESHHPLIHRNMQCAKLYPPIYELALLISNLIVGTPLHNIDFLICEAVELVHQLVYFR